MISLQKHLNSTASPSFPPPAFSRSQSITQLSSVLGTSREQYHQAPGWVLGSRFAPCGMSRGPSLITHFDSVEKLFNAWSRSLTKPVPCTSPIHYTFGVASYTGANPTEDLDELDSCDCLHNVWHASSSAFPPCYLTAIERMSMFIFFLLSLPSPSLISLCGDHHY